MYFAATIRNHAKLTNLSYAAAGHTGFEPTIAAGTVADYWRGDKTWQALPAVTPGGSDGQVQYNNGGVFGGAAGFTYDDATGQVAFTLQADVASGNAYSFAGADAGELTAASGVQPFVSVTPRIRHTGTASWIGLYVNPTVISSGSGAQVAAAFMGGNVGIGTTGPGSRLAVVGADSLNTSFAGNISGATGTGLVITNAGNVGIGTTSPDSKLHVSGAIETSSASEHHYYNVLSYYIGLSNQTGTIKITMPKYGSNTMLHMVIRGYNYTGVGAWEVVLGGYNYSTHTWYGYSAQINGRAPFNQVRLANDGVNDLILLGTTSTIWNYSTVEISEVIATHSNTTGWGSGWSASLVTSETGIVNIVTPTLYTYITSTGKVGIGTTGPVISGTGKLHMAANTFRLDTARTPASAAAAGNAGEFCWDASYLYVCIAAATWRRLAHNTW